MLLAGCRNAAGERIVNIDLVRPGLDALNAMAELIRRALSRSSGGELVSERPHQADALCILLK